MRALVRVWNALINLIVDDLYIFKAVIIEFNIVLKFIKKITDY